MDNVCTTATGSNIYESGTSTGTAVNYSYSTCWFKLPCGYCSQLGRLCPMTNNGQTTITWNGLKCEVKDD